MSKYFEGANDFSVGSIAINHASERNSSPLQKLVDFVAGAAGASHDSIERHPFPICYPGTQRPALATIDSWFSLRSQNIPLLWLTGPTGIGKTTIAQTFAEQIAFTERLAGSFFFSRSSPERCDSSRFVATLALQLAASIPGFRDGIEQMIQKHSLILTKAPEVQLEKLILEPLRIAQTAGISQWLLVIDGLDECVGETGSDTREQEQELVVSLIFELVSKSPIPFAVLLSSRAEEWLKEVFKIETYSTITEELPLYQSQLVDNDIWHYFYKEFQRICSRPRNAHLVQSKRTPWPPPDVYRILVDRASGQFVFATTAIRYIDDQHSVPQKQLEGLMASIRRTKEDPEIFSAVDGLYMDILNSCPVANRPFMLEVLAEVICLRDGVSNLNRWNVLDGLFHRTPGESRQALHNLHSVVNMDGSIVQNGRTFSLFHVSFRDFLTSRNRAEDFYIDIPSTHSRLLCACLDALAAEDKDCGAYIYAFHAWRSVHLPEAQITEIVVTRLRDFKFREWFIECMSRPIILPQSLPLDGVHWFHLISEWVWGHGLLRSNQLASIQDDALRRKATACVAYFESCHDESLLWFLDKHNIGPSLRELFDALCCREGLQRLSAVALPRTKDGAYRLFLTLDSKPILDLIEKRILKHWSLNSLWNIMSFEELEAKLDGLLQSGGTEPEFVVKITDLNFGAHVRDFHPGFLRFLADESRSKHYHLLTQDRVIWLLRHMLEDPMGLPEICNPDNQKRGIQSSGELLSYAPWFNLLRYFLDMAHVGSRELQNLLKQNLPNALGAMGRLGYRHMQTRFHKAALRHLPQAEHFTRP